MRKIRDAYRDVGVTVAIAIAHGQRVAEMRSVGIALFEPRGRREARARARVQEDAALFGGGVAVIRSTHDEIAVAVTVHVADGDAASKLDVGSVALGAPSGGRGDAGAGAVVDVHAPFRALAARVLGSAYR